VRRFRQSSDKEAEGRPDPIRDRATPPDTDAAAATEPGPDMEFAGSDASDGESEWSVTYISEREGSREAAADEDAAGHLPRFDSEYDDPSQDPAVESWLLEASEPATDHVSHPRPRLDSPVTPQVRSRGADRTGGSVGRTRGHVFFDPQAIESPVLPSLMPPLRDPRAGELPSGLHRGVPSPVVLPASDPALEPVRPAVKIAAAFLVSIRRLRQGIDLRSFLAAVRARADAAGEVRPTTAAASPGVPSPSPAGKQWKAVRERIRELAAEGARRSVGIWGQLSGTRVRLGRPPGVKVWTVSATLVGVVALIGFGPWLRQSGTSRFQPPAAAASAGAERPQTGARQVDVPLTATREAASAGSSRATTGDAPGAANKMSAASLLSSFQKDSPPAGRATSTSTDRRETAASRRMPAQRPSPRTQTSSSAAGAPPDRRSDRFIGTIEVTSVPSGATVAINNRPVGATPLVLTDFPAGTHAVRVELAGFHRWGRAVLVATGQRARVNATLSRVSEAGSLAR
jgi:hypothetical protein